MHLSRTTICYMLPFIWWKHICFEIRSFLPLCLHLCLTLTLCPWLRVYILNEMSLAQLALSCISPLAQSFLLDPSAQGLCTVARCVCSGNNMCIYKNIVLILTLQHNTRFSLLDQAAISRRKADAARVLLKQDQKQNTDCLQFIKMAV